MTRCYEKQSNKVRRFPMESLNRYFFCLKISNFALSLLSCSHTLFFSLTFQLSFVTLLILLSSDEVVIFISVHKQLKHYGKFPIFIEIVLIESIIIKEAYSSSSQANDRRCHRQLARTKRLIVAIHQEVHRVELRLPKFPACADLHSQTNHCVRWTRNSHSDQRTWCLRNFQVVDRIEE